MAVEYLSTNIGVAGICRKHGLSPTTFGNWRKRFMDAGKRELAGIGGNGRSDPAKAQAREIEALKIVVGELTLVNAELKKAGRRGEGERGQEDSGGQGEPDPGAKVLRRLALGVLLQEEARQEGHRHGRRKGRDPHSLGDAHLRDGDAGAHRVARDAAQGRPQEGGANMQHLGGKMAKNDEKQAVRAAKARKPQFFPAAPYHLLETDITYMDCGVDGWRYRFNVLDVSRAAGSDTRSRRRPRRRRPSGRRPGPWRICGPSGPGGCAFAATAPRSAGAASSGRR